jgi:hypothetical protein
MQKKLLVQDQNVYDIVHHVLIKHKENASDFDKISEMFWTGDVDSTAENVFNFCKKYIPYSIESAKTQTVKTPGAIIDDALNGSADQDCKHMALICCGIIDSLHRKGYPISCKYRFASDVKNELYPKHVFCIVPTNGGVLWVDPVLDTFNEFHKYYYLKDKKPKNMALYSVSGVNNQYIDKDYVCGFGEVGAHGNGKKKLHNAWREIKRGTAAATLSVPRNSFLLLMELNGKNLAKTFYEGGQNPKMLEKIKAKWIDVGGKWSALRNAINKGYDHYIYYQKKKRNPKYHNLSGFGESNTVGSVVALAASAEAILTAFAGIIKELQHNTPQDVPLQEMAENIPMRALPGKDVDPNTASPMRSDYIEPQPDYSVKQNVKTRELIKSGDQEIPEAVEPIAQGVNVVTDWVTGIKNFVVNNQGTALTLAALTTAIIIAPHFSSKKRR